MKCPVCEKEMELKTNEFKIKVGYGISSSKIHIYVCPECGYDIDDKGNQKIIKETLKKTNYDCADKILNSLKDEGKSFSEIERKFNLPARTLSKWLNKSIKPSASAITLLRIIKAFPWMEKVADLQFESNEAQEYVYNHYASRFNVEYKQIGYTYFQKPNTVFVIIEDKERDNYITNIQKGHPYKGYGVKNQ